MRRRKSSPRIFEAWAVEKDFDWGESFLGRFACGAPPVHLRGCEILLFQTRAPARALASNLRAADQRWGCRHPGARAKRVIVTVRTAR